MDIQRIKKVVEMPLRQKVEEVNRYIYTLGMDCAPLSLDDIANHPGKECLVNNAYLRITRPHIPSV